MSLILKQSTAVVVSFGPFLDKTDGVTPETGLVTAIDHATTGILLSKNGGALTIRSQAVTASTYDAYGNYRVTLSATDTNTVGTLRAQFIETATCLPVWQDFIVVEEEVYDDLFAASAVGYLKPVTAGRDVVIDAAGLADANMVKSGPTGTGTAQTARDIGATLGVAGAGLTGVPWNAAWDAEAESEALDALNTILADSIPADGTLPTVRQALYMLASFMLEKSISGTTVTVKKADGITSLFTLTLSPDGVNPTVITRAT